MQRPGADHPPASDTIGIDTLPPLGSVHSITETSAYAYGSGDTAYYNSAGSGQFSVRVTASDTGSGLDQATYPETTSPGGVYNTVLDEDYQYQHTYTFDGADTASGTYSVTLQDGIGRQSSVDFSVIRDTTPPTLTLEAVVQSDVLVTWSSDDSGSGVDASTCLLEVREDDGDWQTFSTECGGEDATYDGQPGHTYTFRLSASDNVGNAASTEVEALVPYVKKYYYANGQRVAMQKEGVVYYIHSDHLGSVSLVTDHVSEAVARQLYHPYGTVRHAEGTLPTDYTFTGQRDEAGLGLMHYGARFYSPRLGRFVGADTIVPEPGEPQALNRYSYVYNNPVIYTDPSGHCPLSMPECWTVIDGHQVPIDRDFPGGYYHIPVTGPGENWGVDLPYDPVWDRPMGVEAAVAMGDTPEQYYQGMATMFSLLLSAMGWASAWSAAERTAWTANEAAALGMLDDTASMLDDAMYVNQRAAALQSKLPAVTRDKVTMAAAIAKDANGARSILIGSSEGSTLRSTVGQALLPDEVFVSGSGALHAETNILNYAMSNDLQLDFCSGP